MIIWLGCHYGPYIRVGNTCYDPVSWITWYCYSRLIGWLWETGQAQVSFAQGGWGCKIEPL